MTTICCVWVKGHVKYPEEYVHRLQAMVKRWMDARTYRFVCLTDRPWELRAVDTIPVVCPRPLKGWWSKINLFNAGLMFKDRVLYLDLDTLIVGPLAPILDYPSPFALIPHAGLFEGRDGLKVVKRFNSSVMVWNAGVNHKLFDDWTPSVAERLHGDQCWIGEQMPEADTMPLKWFPRISELGTELPSKDVKIVLMKTPKNVEASRRFKWVQEAWA